jgi:hypothetical protein
MSYYAATVIVPAAAPIAAELVIVDVVLVPLSLTVPPFNAMAFVPIDSMSPALVAASFAAIVSWNLNLLLPDP